MKSSCVSRDSSVDDSKFVPMVSESEKKNFHFNQTFGQKRKFQNFTSNIIKTGLVNLTRGGGVTEGRGWVRRVLEML